MVAVSGYGQAADIQRALAAGFDYHATKPLTIGDCWRWCPARRPSTDASALVRSELESGVVVHHHERPLLEREAALAVVR